jgi:hypothetical protein
MRSFQHLDYFVFYLLKVFVETAYASEVFEAIKYTNSSVFFSNTAKVS